MRYQPSSDVAVHQPPCRSASSACARSLSMVERMATCLNAMTTMVVLLMRKKAVAMVHWEHWMIVDGTLMMVMMMMMVVVVVVTMMKVVGTWVDSGVSHQVRARLPLAHLGGGCCCCCCCCCSMMRTATNDHRCCRLQCWHHCCHQRRCLQSHRQDVLAWRWATTRTSRIARKVVWYRMTV
jgi:hypothetical protein